MKCSLSGLALVVAGLLLTASPSPVHAQSFIRGDANSDEVFDISDAIFTLAALFTPGSPSPGCLDAADSNDDGQFDVSDAVYSLASLFVPGSPSIPTPHPDCGTDPTADALGCAIPPSGCTATSTPLPFSGLILAISSAISTEYTEIIRNESDFLSRWAEHYGAIPAPPPPAIDFSQEMVILIARPMSPPSNYLWITSVTAEPGFIDVQYTRQMPDPFCVVEPTPVLVHMVRVAAYPGPIDATQTTTFSCFAPF